jgi:hypothetical protein
VPAPGLPGRLSRRPHLHRARSLTDHDRALVQSIPVTSLARTLLDYADTVSRERLDKGIERAEELEVEAAGLPKPATGFNELGHELDVCWPVQRLVVELDLFETHGTRGAFERDRLRQEDLLLAGIRTMRVTGPRLACEPQAVIERVARLLAQGERRGSAR